MSKSASIARGFTLIEVMIVIAIIGVTVAMIRLGGNVLERVNGGGDEGGIDAALRRFAYSVAEASERAQVRGQPIALDLSTGRYRFYVFDAAGRWLLIENDPVLAERAVPDDWRWEQVQREGVEMTQPMRLLLSNEPVRFSIQIVRAEQRHVLRGNSAGAIDWVAQ